MRNDVVELIMRNNVDHIGPEARERFQRALDKASKEIRSYMDSEISLILVNTLMLLEAERGFDLDAYSESNTGSGQRELRAGDEIICQGVRAKIDKVHYFYENRGEYIVEFTDANGNYRNWHSVSDGGYLVYNV